MKIYLRQSVYFCANSMLMRNDLIKYCLIALGAAVLFIPFLGQVHLFDWDEVNFAECAREMLVTKSYLRVQVDFQPFWEKPPVFIWMQALCMHVFGVNEFAARLPNALVGIFTLCSLFYIGKKVINERMAWWWVIIYAASWLPHFYFKTAIIDPTFNLFIFLSFFQVFLIKNGKRKLLHAVLAGIFIGIAVLTKGPVAILVCVLSLAVYLVWNRGLRGYMWYHFVIIVVACLLTTSLWFGVDILQNGWWFTQEFIAYQVRLFRTEDAGHGGPFYYHFIVLLVGCFPASAFLFQYLKRQNEQVAVTEFTKWMWILLWVVLILFSIVKTKIVHYSSLCYFPITFLAAVQVSRIDAGAVSLQRVVKMLIMLIGVLIGLALLALPVIGMHKEILIPYIDDDFAVANLRANVVWGYEECLVGLLYLVGVAVSLYLVKKSFRRGMLLLLVTHIFTIQLTMTCFVPKIEKYTQNAAVRFYKALSGQDVYLQPLGFVSYGYLFYSQKHPHVHPDYYKNKLEFLLDRPVDKPTYFITKSTMEEEWSKHPNLKKIGSSNGYVFFQRK